MQDWGQVLRVRVCCAFLLPLLLVPLQLSRGPALAW